jgi:hypothetical protein
MERVNESKMLTVQNSLHLDKVLSKIKKPYMVYIEFSIRKILSHQVLQFFYENIGNNV